MVYRSPFRDEWIPEIPLADFVFTSAATRLDKAAVIDGASGRSVSYRQMRRAIATTAQRLAERGVRKGDIVALHGPNSPEYITAFYAVTSLGAIVTTLNPFHNAAELSYQLIDSGARLLVASALSDKVRRAAERVGMGAIVPLDPIASCR